MFTATIEVCVRRYLTKKLNQGHHEFIYGLTNYWGSLNGLGNYLSFSRPSCQMQKRLIEEFGYTECPHCYWAIARSDDHEYCKSMLEDRSDHE